MNNCSLRLEDLLGRLDKIKEAISAAPLTDAERLDLLESLRRDIVDLLSVAYEEGDRNIRRSSDRKSVV